MFVFEEQYVTPLLSNVVFLMFDRNIDINAFGFICFTSNSRRLIISTFGVMMSISNRAHYTNRRANKLSFEVYM